MTAEQKKTTRRLLLTIGPLGIIIVTAFFWIFSGRYISTDNSYVKAHKVMVSPEVSGTILPVTVRENQPVRKGDVLFAIDPTSFKIALAKAEANVTTVRDQIDQLKATARQKGQEIVMAQQDAAFAESQYKRRAEAAMKEAVSKESLDAAQHDRDVAQTKIKQLQQERDAILAQLGGNADTAAEDLPAYKSAAAERDAAKLNLDRTIVRAPVNGLTGAMPNSGDYAHAGIPSLSVVEDQDVWIEANYKETELTSMRPGQKADIEVDTYPGRKWTGTVESISPATGSEFSLLPAQNATGNWVKVVQRIAVRIRPDVHEGDPPLRAGMSANVTVDTGSYPHLPGERVAEVK
jgi:membrane fusion protein (multidrug efflux system)